MKQYCRYHPIASARWHCTKCRLSYCRDCVPLADAARRDGACPHCKHPLTYLNERRHEAPFWDNDARFYRLPLQREPLLLIVILGILGSVAPFNTITSLLVLALFVLLTHRYAHAIAQRFAQGKTDAPSLQSIGDNTGRRATLALMLAGTVLCVPPLLALYFDNTLGALLLGLLALLIAPALLISTLRQNDFLAALRPSSLLAPIVRLQGAYLILVAHVGTCILLIRIVCDIGLRYLPLPYATALATVLTSYCILALAALFGYTLCQYEARTPDEDEGASAQRAIPRSQAQVLHTQALIDMALKDGDLDTLVSLLKTEMKQKRATDLRRDQLCFLLLQREDYDALMEDAEIYLWRLLARSKVRDAIKLLKLLRKHDQNFRLYDLELSLKLAEHAAQLKDYRLVLWLARDGHSRFKPEPALRKLYLMAANILSSKFQQKEKAAVFLDYVNRHLSDHSQSA